MHIALATCRDLPRLDPDEALLIAAFERLGAVATPVVWEDDAVDYARFDGCVIRSTWDYTDKREAFVGWADRAAARTTLWNGARTVRWNTHKGYLRELEARGVRIVPTAWAGQGTQLDLRAVARERGWTEIVIKPAVGAGARRTIRTRDLSEASAHLAALTAGGDAMIQPYLPSVEGRGERSLIFFDSAFSHAIRKHPALLSGPRHGGEAPVEATADEIAFAHRVLAHVPEPTLYARVDIVRDDGRSAGNTDAGPIALMELELVEPSLFFAQSPGSEDVLARAVLVRARR